MEDNLNISWVKDFDNWNVKKKEINDSEKEEDFYFKEREIWWCALGMNIGYEEDGKNEHFERPIMILKIFNKEVLWALPLTSKEKIGKYYYNFNLDGKNSSVILSQLRLISSKRLIRKIGMLPKTDFLGVRKNLIKFL